MIFFLQSHLQLLVFLKFNLKSKGNLYAQLNIHYWLMWFKE